jgi:hypothetical protein
MMYGNVGVSPKVRVQTVQATNTDQTITAMRKMVDDYYGDVAPYAFYSLDDFYNMVKSLPYKMENRAWNAQILQRPKFSLFRVAPVVACANKAILMGAYFKLQGIPFGFVVSANSKNTPFGHVFNWANLFGKRVFIDATYPENTIFLEKKYPKRKVYE